jgi:hypothetical protein
MLKALSFEETDYVPCCFSAFMALERKFTSQEEYIDRQLEMGLDVVVRINDPPIRHDPSVKVKEWRVDATNEPYPTLHIEYRTPAGVLSRSVKQTEDWPYGDHVPFVSDHIIPRGTKRYNVRSSLPSRKRSRIEDQVDFVVL